MPTITFKEKNVLKIVTRDISYKVLNVMNVKTIARNVLMKRHALYAILLMFYNTVTVYLNAKKDMSTKTVFVLKNLKLKLDFTEILI